MLARVATLLAAAGGGLAAATVLLHDKEDDAITSLEGGIRFLRAGAVAAHVSLDYKWTLRNSDSLDPEEEKRLKSELHTRSAERILELCREHKGIFTKAGQHVSTLNHAIPAEYTRVLAQLQDQVAPARANDMERVFREDFGQRLGEVFREFGPEPIASASLAQVHRARLHDGRLVAVKVQYPKLRIQLQGDMFTIRTLVRGVEWMWPELSLQWIVPEFRAALVRELDFELEGRTAERVAKQLAAIPNLKIPDVYWRWCSHRVLTMEFIEGHKITDLEGMRGAGIAPRGVARTLLEVFSKMIFIDGHVHCDPHPGNLLVRRWPQAPGGYQVVLLDHGLYRELEPGFRREYCALWQALVRRDEAALLRSARALGAERYAALLPLFLVQRPWSSVARRGTDLSHKMSREEIKRLRAELRGAGIGHGDFVEFLRDLPRDMLLVLRTNNFLRAINKDLGAPANRFAIMAEYSLRGLYSPMPPRPPGCPVGAARALVAGARFTLELGALRARLALYDALLEALRLYLLLAWRLRATWGALLRLPPPTRPPPFLFAEKLG
eukprot:tig00001525_g9233.t1